MNLQHQYICEILDADQLVWDDKYSSMVLPSHFMLGIYAKIHDLYVKNTDPNIDKRFYYWARSYTEQTRAFLNDVVQSINERYSDDIPNTNFMFLLVDSFSTIENIKNSYEKNNYKSYFMFGDNKKVFSPESFEQYVVYLRSLMMIDPEDCLEFIPKVNLDNPEFSSTYDRILPLILQDQEQSQQTI